MQSKQKGMSHEKIDSQYRDAELVGLDLASDIAVIKVDAPANQLNPIRFADSD